ncbi:MAG: glycosyltransferase [Myxococcota bacterium]|nr:glycosyltransferase [Myxococcota bacterium]
MGAEPSSFVWHVAAMPFPSPQGTQAAVAAMVTAEVRAGRSARLLTYGEGVGPPPEGIPVQRAWRVPGSASLRSGPSVRKLAADALLAAALRRVACRAHAAFFVAHHVEALLAALPVRRRGPVVYVAHTSLQAELPVYFAAGVLAPAATVGRTLDVRAVRWADAAVAVAPRLAARLQETSGRAVGVVPLPWPLPPPTHPEAWLAARTAIGVPLDAEVILYAGNLDPYQGWEDLVEVLARLVRRRPRLRLLVATASPSEPLFAEARRAGVADRLHVVPLRDEADRRDAHAAADVAVVPRRVEGGVSVKWIDAMARGVPVVAAELATGGYAIDPQTALVTDGEGAALAAATAVLLGAPERHAFAERARRWVARVMSAEAYLAAMDAAVERARATFGARAPRRC